jgi:MFS family permease
VVTMVESPYAALKIRDFRLLVGGRLLITLALQIQGMAVGWQIYELTKSPLYLGFAGLAEALPALGIALYAGHVADMIDRKKIAIGSVLMLVVSIALLTLCTGLFAHHHALVYIIFAIIAFSGFARGFYGPAVFGMVSDIVPREFIGNAAAWNSAIWQGSAVIGPILGGALYLFLGATNTYLVSTIFLALSFFCICLIKTSTVVRAQGKVDVVTNIKEGLHFVFSNQVILGAMALDLFAVLFGGAVALLPIFSAQIFHLGPQALGFLRAAPSVGALLTSSYLTHHPINKDAGRTLLFSVGGFGLCMIAFALSSNFCLSLALLALSGALDGVSIYVRTTIFQLSTPEHMKGRVSAVNNIFIGSSNEIGEFESGMAAKFLGLIPSVVFGGCMTLLVVMIAAIKAPKLRRLSMDTLLELKSKPVETVT